MTTMLEKAARALQRLSGLCVHEWEDDYEFVSCYICTISTDPDVEPTRRPHSIQTMQWCPLCDGQRRKPGSARAAIDITTEGTER